MFNIINRLRTIPVTLLLLAFVSLNCHAGEDKFSNYLDKINSIVSSRSELPKSIYKKQREELTAHKGDIRELDLKNKSGQDSQNYQKRRYGFDHEGIKERLIGEWEKEYKSVSWPRYHCDNCCRGKKSCHFFEAHHVIPLGYNGSNEWWNIFPLTMKEHTGKGTGIHSSAEAKALFSKVKKKKT